MNYINLAALENTTTELSPFPYLVVPNFINTEKLHLIEKDYPKITQGGSFPLLTLEYGPHFSDLLSEIRSSAMASVLSKKLSINLENRPTTLTVRGVCRPTDGKIHIDSKQKLVTVLIYMNDEWEAKGGRLRLLNSPDNINDIIAEIPPIRGTLLAFRNQHNAWHGHESFEGQRRTIQLNWVKSPFFVAKEQMRHRLSTLFKRSFTKEYA